MAKGKLPQGVQVSSASMVHMTQHAYHMIILLQWTSLWAFHRLQLWGFYMDI